MELIIAIQRVMISLKYANYDIVFEEVPDETTLAINISNCPMHCEGCHSKYLWEDIGTPLTFAEVQRLIKENLGITCVGLMGGDSNPKEVYDIAKYIKEHCNLKVAWYSGKNQLNNQWIIEDSDNPFDYLKFGPYIQSKGGLSSPTTNQKFYKVIDRKLIDITDYFQNKGKD